MKRIPEPAELMDDVAQAQAYHDADFEEAHGGRLDLVREYLPGPDFAGQVLDLGCGSGDVLIRFARAFPGATFLGVDGSPPMIALARQEVDEDEDLLQRVLFQVHILPSSGIPRCGFDLIMSHSFLHHLHDPSVLWETVADLSRAGTRICVVDLRRPGDEATANEILKERAANGPEVLRRDFYNSLLAAFTVDEVREQLDEAHLVELQVEEIGDLYLVVHGVIGG